MKHIVCYSGGASSAKVAINVVNRYGKDNVILLNHDINSSVEDIDVKRFKQEVADYLGLPITYANWQGKEGDDIVDHFDLCEDLGGFQFGVSQVMCTYRLKTLPFKEYLEKNFPVEGQQIRDDVTIYYGFDADEPHRISRRSGILATMGYKADFPIAFWKDYNPKALEEANIRPPLQYSKFKHANCAGCLKAGKQHWYVIFCERPDIWERAKLSEDRIGHSILKSDYLEDLEDDFKVMRCEGIEPTEYVPAGQFWANAKKVLQNRFNLKLFEADSKPCECTF